MRIQDTWILDNQKFTGLKIGHSYGKIKDIMVMLHVNRKRRQLNIPELFQIYEDVKKKKHVNDTYEDAYNPISDAVTDHKNSAA
jgi:hypothetical protein